MPTMIELEFQEELNSILKKWKEGSVEEALDGDEVDRLIKVLKVQLNFIEGNITDEEYLKDF